MREMEQDNCGACDKDRDDEMVQCDDCDGWYHFSCVGATKEVEQTPWSCYKCESQITITSAEGTRMQAGKKSDGLSKSNTLTLPEMRTQSGDSPIGAHREEPTSYNSGSEMQTDADKENTASGRRPTELRMCGKSNLAGQYKHDENLKFKIQLLENELKLLKNMSFNNDHMNANEMVRHEDRQEIKNKRQMGCAVVADCQCNAFGKKVVKEATLGTEKLLSRQVLSKDLPEFTGKPEEWPTFISNFENSTRLCGYSNDENLLRLQRALKGKAYEFVRSQLMLPSAVPDIIETLRMIFGRPEYIINSILNKIRASPGYNAQKLDGLITFALEVKNLTATIQAANLNAHLYNPLLLQELINKLPTPKRLDWAMHAKNLKDVNIIHFSDWIFELATAASSVIPYPPNMNPTDARKPQRVGFHEDPSTNKTSKQDKPACALCDQDHSIEKCEKFKKLPLDEKWKTVHLKKMCRSCLKIHNPKFCKERQQCDINGCTAKHHKLLHKYSDGGNETKAPNVVALQYAQTSTVLYRIVPVTLYGNQSQVNTYAFLDDGSGPTILEKELFRKLKIKGKKKAICLRWTDGSERLEQDSEIATLRISPRNSANKQFILKDVRTVSKLDLPKQSLNVDEVSAKYPHLRGLPVESYEFITPQIIIGVNNKHVAMPMKYREGKLDEPAATKTRLGWTIYGVLKQSESATSSMNASLQLHICKCDDDIALDTLFKENMKLDDIVRPQSKDIIEQEVRKYENYIQRRDEGFEARLFWRAENLTLPDNYYIAFKRLCNFENKIKQNSELQTKINALIEEMETKGYIRKLSKEEASKDHPRKWYLPIFAVHNPNKPSKTRIVWDAAAEYKGISLNKCLETGPDLLQPLVEVLYNFRIGQIGICADIAEMFHRVRIRDDDHQSQRFLWRMCEINKAPEIYILQVCSFGARCSPCIAQLTKNKNADDFSAEFPRAHESIKKWHYMDDMMDSVNTTEEAIKLATQVREVHRRGNFHIRNWLSNSKEVLAAMGETKRKDTFCNAGQRIEQIVEPEKVLGLFWQTETDNFVFSTKFSKANSDIMQGVRLPTKRELLRLTMSIFDPLGFIAFFTIRVKILIQQIWRTGIHWDDPIPQEFKNAWNQWLAVFKQVNEAQIPRCYFKGIDRKNFSVDLHVFVDASEDAYAAAAYFRAEKDGKIHVSMVCAKARVAPLRPGSVPRMELLAAVLGSRLATNIRIGHELPIENTFYWSDSRTVLLWLRSDPRKYKPFVKLRIAEIQETTDVTKWHHIPSKENVADAATKWKTSNEFSPSCTWFTGPTILYNSYEAWPTMTLDEQELSSDNHEFVAFHQKVDDLIEYSRFSNWNRLCRCASYVLRFIKECRKRKTREKRENANTQERRVAIAKIAEVSSLKSDELLAGQSLLYRLAQTNSFCREINALKNNKDYVIPKESAIRKLSPFLDDNGVLRIKGRIENSSVHADVKNPIILPKKSRITTLVIAWYHTKFHHVHHETVLNEINQKFYIPSLRRMLKSVRRSCQYCENRDAHPVPPEMGQLPEARLAAFVRPFSFVGIDFFGPILVTFGRRMEKRYGVLFTCLTCRAVHIEVAHSLSMNSCVMAVRNFIARRGTPLHIYTDNGTNFVATEKELREAYRQIDFDKLQQEFTTAETKWTFIPPASPHMGGSWERLVRSVKDVLYKIITPETRLSDEKLYNFLLEVESILNSRPLTYVSLDSADQEALTPNHLHLGSSAGTKPIGQFVPSDQYVKNSWRHSQLLAERFWKRWLLEFLPTLTRRTKWFNKVKPIEIGDVVIIVDPNLPRHTWPKGIVTQTVMAKDGQVRSAHVRTTNGIYHRPACKLAVLDVLPASPGPGTNEKA